MRRSRTALTHSTLPILLMMFTYAVCLAQRDGDPISIGTYRVMHSNILNEDRLLFVHLPREYQQTQLRYPVLYLLYAHLYEYFADAATITENLGGTGEIPPLIIVGVANTNRYRDLLPVKSQRIAESGGADNFLRFLERELIPYVDETYRTKEFRILAGPQAAAVFNLYALVSRPTLFQASVSENPFTNAENAAYLFPLAEQFFKNTKSLKCFLYIRCENNERPQDLDYAQRFRKLFEAGKPQGFRVNVEITEPSGYFTPPLPFSEALRSLFIAHRLPSDFQTSSLKDVLDYYKDRSEEYGFDVDPPEHMLTFEGVKLNQKGQTSKAIEVFEYQRRLYPKSLNALLQLGESYRGMGQFEQAKKYYKAFLSIEQRDAAYVQRRLVEMERMIDSSAAYRVELEIRQNGIQAGLKSFQTIKSDPHNRFYVSENEFNAMGYRFMGAGNVEAALEIFKLNVQLNPQSANVYDSLGEVYLKIGDNDNARKNYKKSLELNPQNTNAREVLKGLEKK
jgi:predicted alpha/beta superfamily hydrolase/thioredoxin-like negative regulator of GroEL